MNVDEPSGERCVSPEGKHDQSHTPTKSTGEKRAEARRKASAKYYAQHPEVREKKRVQMAERRAAVKAKRRQWDPPKKSKTASNNGTESAARPEPDPILRALVPRAILEEQEQSGVEVPDAADLTSESDSSTGDEASDEEYKPGGGRVRIPWGGRTEKAKKVAKRKASAKYYAKHPEIREKRRIQMAERRYTIRVNSIACKPISIHARAAIKARRRRWDPPKKTKPVVLQEASTPTDDHAEPADSEESPEEEEKEEQVLDNARAARLARRRQWVPSEKTKPVRRASSSPDSAHISRDTDSDESKEEEEEEEEDLDDLALGPLSAADWD
ncbi:hypothetical protein B0H11DRAFT_638642 [Mycena galericulata]|nr:hypothetical protein B0H11DRAFT_638642 [Mycena galericulata]